VGAVEGASVGAVVGAIDGPRARGDGFSRRAPTTARSSRLFARSNFAVAEGSDESTGCSTGCTGCTGCNDCNDCTDTTCGAAADSVAVDETSVVVDETSVVVDETSVAVDETSGTSGPRMSAELSAESDPAASAS
jgi:hypothetical protein